MNDFIFVPHRAIAGQNTKKKKKKKERKEVMHLINMPETDQNWSVFSK
jgi:hypothetical protein